MEWNKVLFLIPYLLALIIITSIFFYAWRHRHIRGGSAYTWYVAGQVLWAIGYILELLAPTLNGKVFWDSFQWIAGFFIVIAFPVFAVEYTSYQLKRPRLVWGLVSIVPIAMTLLVLTDSQHHLIYPNPHLFYDSIFPELEYNFTWVVYGYAIYSYLVTFTGLGLLVNRMVHPHRLYRRQIFTVALGFFIPIFFTILTVAGVEFMPYRDVSIFTFALGNLIVAWGLFRYNLFEVVPIARHLLIENMEDLVVVLDMQDRIVDINPVALGALNLDSSQVIGQPAEIIFNPWPELVEKFFRPENIKTEISLSASEDVNRYEIKSTLLHDKNNRYIGRVFVARDVTERVALQKKLEKLNENLEERVRERAEELNESVERYRAVVENQTEFIVRWNLDGTNVFANEAYCRYFGVTQKQASEINFASFLDEKDWPTLREKTGRLWSGQIESETNIYYVRKPNGSYGWQEWTDQVIRDKNGKVIEIQSVGRDITERKQAEEALRESEAIYRQAIEVAGAVPYRQSYPGNSIRVNYDFIGEGIRQVTGYGPEEFSAALWDSLVQESHLLEDLAGYSWEEAIQRVRSGTNPIWQCEYRIRTRDGEIRWVYEAAVELRDSDGISHGSIGLYQDITERKQAEEELRKLSHAVEQSNTSIVITDIDGIIEYVNPYFSELTGYTLEEAIGQSPSILQSGLTEDTVYEDLWATITNSKEWQGEFCNKKKNGELYWESASISPIIDGSGKITHFVAVKTDITENRRAELALRESEKKHRLLFESANDGIFIMKADRIIDCNAKTLELFGCQRAQIIGKSPADFSPATQPDGQNSQEKTLEKIEAVQEGKPQFLEWKHCRLDSTLFDAEVSLNLLELDGEVYIQAIVRDITGRKQAEETILRQLAFEELMTRILTRFATSAHDEIDTNIQEALHEIATFMNVERTYIIIINPEHQTTWSTTHEWCASHIPPRLMERQNIPFGTFPWMENSILSGNITRINTLDDYPPDASADRELHMAEGAQSTLNVPIRRSQGPINGCIGGQTYSYTITWSEDDVAHLKIAGDVIANVLERKRAEDNLIETYDTTLEGWARALELRDKETEDHSQRVTELTIKLAQAMGIKGDELTHIRRGAILHDIGKMAIPDEILLKRGPLTDSERKVVEQHPIRGYELLSPISFLEKALEIPYCHHEHWDGSGYPRGLKGEEIPIAARIFSVVDVWDALRSNRPYSRAWPKEKTIQYLKTESGKHFDPACVSVFLGLVEQGKI